MNFDITTSGIPLLLLAFYIALYSCGRGMNHNETMVSDTTEN